MRIAQVAPLFEPVPPKLYGGTERVVSYITEELVRRGHQVILFASGDSRTHARLNSAITNSIRLDGTRPDSYAYHYLELTDVFSQADEFDIIHCHLEYLAFPFSKFFGTPSVHTLHGRLDLPYWVPMMTRFPDTNLVSISNNQRLPLGEIDIKWMDTIYHGLPDPCFRFYRDQGKYLAYYSRMSPEKRPDLAIQIAKKAGIPLKMAGKVDHQESDFFKTIIEPQLDPPFIEFLGELSEEERHDFLGNALALIFPIEWPEPFGLVMIEAMANGTPVISRPFGAVPEVIDEGITGLIGNDTEKLVALTGEIVNLAREGCFLRARERFSAAAMVDRYENVYRTLINQDM